jgi:hypothetical protein
VIEVLLGYANKLVLPFAVLCRIEEALRGS